ncbi:Rieske (2Fe-2S) protein [Sphingomonas profundi]|uniref:Rieske (2Fe-2S) protein n=1 Tax=Alterirhizorhabdus profundi TaxID=2681549 RepID=UPI0012E742AE|nr:Rieske 2Fe-2S domain-containing protein [Sphingomonas profundi]
MTETFHRALADADLGDNKAVGVILNGWPVAVCRADGAIFAVVDKCTHANALLSDGRVRRGAIMCPLHGARFDLAGGACIGGAYRPLKTFAHRLADGWIEVAVPDEKPGHEHEPVRRPG